MRVACSHHAMNASPQRGLSSARIFLLVGGALVALVGVLLIDGSQSLLFVDTNDFGRVVGHLHLTSRGDGIHWSLPEGPFGAPENPELATSLFSIAGWVQRYLPGGMFDISRTALAAKCLLLAYAFVLARQCAAAQRHGGWWCMGIALAWLGMFFMAHNIGMAQSLYAEYVFLIALPLLLVGVLTTGRKVRLACLAGGALACGLAKVQYFYVPALMLACVWGASRWNRVALDKALLKLLLAAQVLCLVPLLMGKNAALNAHHAVYLGSYLVLSPAQLETLGVPAERRSCIGVDAWGNALSGPGGTHVRQTGRTCHPEMPRLGKREVLRPYLRFPQILLHLLRYSLPHHFTVHYFHVYPGYFYLKRVDDGTRPVTSLLVRMTDGRNRFITPLAPALLVAAVVFFGLSRRAGEGMRRLALGGLILSLLVVTQVVVALLGEGVRDLSKHLWGAQLALDMLVVLVVLQCMGWLARLRRVFRSEGAGELRLGRLSGSRHCLRRSLFQQPGTELLQGLGRRAGIGAAQKVPAFDVHGRIQRQCHPAGGQVVLDQAALNHGHA